MKKFLRSFLLMLATCSGATLASAQVRPSALPRITATSGLADSSLFICNDSTNTRTNACTFLNIQKRLAFRQFDTLKAKRLRIDTVKNSPVWLTAQTFTAGQRVDSATGSARAQTLTTARTINGTSFNGSANITVTAAAGTVTGSALNSSVVTSSLTSVGTLTALTVSGVTTVGGTITPSSPVDLGSFAAPFFTAYLSNGLGVGKSPTVAVDVVGAGLFTTTLTAARQIGGTDISSAVAKGLNSDGTAFSSNGPSIAWVLGQVVTHSSSAALTQIASEHVIKATTAVNNVYHALRGYAWTSHTSGTVNTINGVTGVAEVGGNGGTVTNVNALSSGGFIATGATATNYNGLVVNAPTTIGTITTLRGINIGNMGTSSAQFAMTTGTGLVQFGDQLILSASTTSRAPIRFQIGGTAPSGPGEGEFWYDGTNLKFRDATTTRTLTWTP